MILATSTNKLRGKEVLSVVEFGEDVEIHFTDGTWIKFFPHSYDDVVDFEILPEETEADKVKREGRY